MRDREKYAEARAKCVCVLGGGGAAAPRPRALRLQPLRLFQLGRGVRMCVRELERNVRDQEASVQERARTKVRGDK
jgi:hypothetical protein